MTIAPHPAFQKLLARLEAFGESFDVVLETDLFRFIDPQFSKAEDIVSGTGALHAAGRWHLAGSTLLSYTSFAPDTALAEAMAHVNYYRLPLAKALPRVLVALRFKARRVLDLSDGKVRQALKLSEATILKKDWRATNQYGAEALTQAWGRAFAEAGFEAVIVPSAADTHGANVLIFPENLQPGSRIEVDDVK